MDWKKIDFNKIWKFVPILGLIVFAYIIYTIGIEKIANTFVLIPFYIAGIIESTIPLISLISKIIVDYVVIFQAARLLNESKLLKYYPVAALFHIPYLIFFGLYGTFGKVQWKTTEKSE